MIWIMDYDNYDLSIEFRILFYICISYGRVIVVVEFNKF